MSVFLFFAGVYLLGLCWSLLARPRLGIGFCCAIAYPLGLVFWVLQSLVILCSPVPYGLGSAVTGCAILVAVGVLVNARSVRRGAAFSSRELAILGSATTLFALATAAITSFNFSVWTYDSHVIINTARSIGFHGEIRPEMGRELASRGGFQVIVQAASALLQVPYLFAAPPMLAASFLGLFGYLGTRALDGLRPLAPGKLALVVLTTCAMTTTYFLLVHYFVMHENFAAAVFIFLFVVCFWFAEREREAGWLAFAFAFLLAFSLNRVEAPLVALLFLMIAHTQSTLPTTLLNRWFLVYALAVGAWCAVLLSHLGDGGYLLRMGPHILNAQRIFFILGAVAGGYLVAVILCAPRLARLRQHAPKLILGALLLASAVALALRTKPMVISGRAIFLNMLDGSFGGIWVAFAVLGLFALLLPRVPFHQVFSYGSASFIAFIYVLSSQREPYSVRWGDTGHRMLLTVVPLMFFFLLVAYGRLTLRGDWAARRIGRAEVDSPQLDR